MPVIGEVTSQAPKHARITEIVDDTTEDVDRKRL
jgi:hypothetical protein